MKKLNYLLFISIFILICVSCGDDDEDPSASLDDLPGALVVTIDGETLDFRYQPRAYVATYETEDDIFDAIFISGTTSIDFTRELNISIINPAVGSFEFGEDFVTNIIYQIIHQDGTGSTYSSNYPDTEGTITITELTSNHIEGTFSGTLRYGENVINVTNGTFDLNISE